MYFWEFWDAFQLSPSRMTFRSGARCRRFKLPLHKSWRISSVDAKVQLDREGVSWDKAGSCSSLTVAAVQRIECEGVGWDKAGSSSLDRDGVGWDKAGSSSLDREGVGWGRAGCERSSASEVVEAMEQDRAGGQTGCERSSASDVAEATKRDRAGVWQPGVDWARLQAQGVRTMEKGLYLKVQSVTHSGG